MLSNLVASKALVERPYICCEGRGINSSITASQDFTGNAEEKAISLGIAVGSGYLYSMTITEGSLQEGSLFQPIKSARMFDGWYS